MKKWKIALWLMAVGLVLSAIGLGLGAKTGMYWDENGVHLEQGTQTARAELEEFSAIETNVDAMGIEILSGEWFAVEMSYSREKPGVEVRDGVLYVKQESKRHWVNFGWSVDWNDKITITVPSDLERITVNNDFGDVRILEVNAKNIKAELDAGNFVMSLVNAEQVGVDNDFGNVKISKVNANSVKAEMDAGNLEMEEVAAEQVVVNSSFGKVKCEDVAFGNLKATLNSGTFAFAGELAEGMDVRSSFGKVEVYLDERERQFDLRTEFGSITFFGEKHKGNLIIEGQNVDSQVKVKNESGNIIVDKF